MMVSIETKSGARLGLSQPGVAVGTAKLLEALGLKLNNRFPGLDRTDADGQLCPIIAKPKGCVGTKRWKCGPHSVYRPNSAKWAFQTLKIERGRRVSRR